MLNQRILISAGEASGDQHGAHLIQNMRAHDPTLKFIGMGGTAMRQQGAHIVVACEDMSVVGAVEILSHAGVIWKAWRTLSRIIKNHEIDLLILIDYPEFNLQLARLAKKNGIKVLYYISPQIWAWKQHRIHTIKKRVDKMLVIFPFEEDLYRRYNVPVEFVGHPLVDTVHPSLSPTEMRLRNALDENRIYIGLLPGSRQGEIKRMLPVQLAAAKLLQHRLHHVTFLLPLASSLNESDILPAIKESELDVRIIKENKYDWLQLCQVAIVTSGTATLELALLGLPMVIVYRVASFTYWLGKYLIKIPYIGLCNIVAQKMIVPELIQKQASAENIANAAAKILLSPQLAQHIRKELQLTRESLGKKNGSENAALAALALLNK